MLPTSPVPVTPLTPTVMLVFVRTMGKAFGTFVSKGWDLLGGVYIKTSVGLFLGPMANR
jgi:hypothetical protein